MMNTATTNTATAGNRLAAIDMLRGLVMVIMALDHVRVMLTQYVPDFSTVSLELFFTRWITHLCAPSFIFLAGISAYIYGTKVASRSLLAHFLVTRGIWLIIIELTVVGFAWNFNFSAQYLPVLQVIWVIGWSMILLAALIWLPLPVIFGFALLLILGHNLLDGVQPAAENASILWYVLHISEAVVINGVTVEMLYPLIPWLGVMALGYAVGPWFTTGTEATRQRRLLTAGIGLTAAFLLLRFFNLYGEPDPWHYNGNLAATVIDFLHTTKYPAIATLFIDDPGPGLPVTGRAGTGPKPLLPRPANRGQSAIFLLHSAPLRRPHAGYGGGCGAGFFR